MSHTVVLVGVVFGDIDIVEIGGLATLFKNTFMVYMILCLSMFDMVGFTKTHSVLVKSITTDVKILAYFDGR